MSLWLAAGLVPWLAEANLTGSVQEPRVSGVQPSSQSNIGDGRR